MEATPRGVLRKDAQRNRDAILQAARELFAESGDVPMYGIARRAGVGQATLYRHFPDRTSVVTAIFAEELEYLERLAGEHTGDPEGFLVVLRAVVGIQVRFHGMVTCLRQDRLPGEEKAALSQRLITLLQPLLREAKAAGTLRPDAGVEDVFLLIAMVEGALDNGSGPEARAAAGARALALTLEGLTTRSPA